MLLSWMAILKKPERSEWPASSKRRKGTKPQSSRTRHVVSAPRISSYARGIPATESLLNSSNSRWSPTLSDPRSGIRAGIFNRTGRWSLLRRPLYTAYVWPVAQNFLDDVVARRNLHEAAARLAGFEFDQL